MKFRIGDITVEVRADLPVSDRTFGKKFNSFRADGPGENPVVLHHHFTLPDIDLKELGEPVYRDAPWEIYRHREQWIYLGILPETGFKENFHQVAIFNSDHTLGDIYSPGPERWEQGNLQSLTLFPTDQILLARILADRNGCMLHSGAMDIRGAGYMFLGHSEAGKSTTVSMLRSEGTILCDDRNILRLGSAGFRVYGTWSHGDVTEVSGKSAPVRALLFINQAERNEIRQLTDTALIFKRLLPLVIKPLVTSEWWRKVMDTLEKAAADIPMYEMYLDRSGKVREMIRSLEHETV